MAAKTTTRNVFASSNGILHVAVEDQPNEGLLYTWGVLGTDYRSNGRVTGSSRCLRLSALTPAGVLVSETDRKGEYFPDAPHV